jgi:hypothetical protein
MSIYNKNQKLEEPYEDGIWLDFQANTWLFFVKDKVWQPEEIQRAEHADVTLTFLQKGISDAFLLEVFDCLEVSDLPFCVKEAGADLLQSFENNDLYKYEIVLVNGDNVVSAIRNGSFTKENTAVLKKKLLARTKEDFTSEDAEHSYQKLAAKYQPYELEEFAVFVQKN